MSVPVDKCGFVEIWIVGQFPLQSGSSVVLKEVLTEYFGVWKHFWKRFRQDNHTTHPAGDAGRKKGKLEKLYRGWMKSGLDHCLFETIANDLKIGDTLTDAFGRVWIVEVIF